MMQIMNGLQALNVASSEGQPPQKMATLTHARLGEPSFGVAPGIAEICVTLRTVLDDDMHSLCKEAESLIARAASDTGLGFELSYHDIFPASTNDPGLVQLIRDVAEACDIPCQPQPAPMRWSEDFGRFGAICSSAMFLLGAGESCPALHNPDYDFPDALIPIGVDAFLKVIEALSAEGR
jgi:metal-dependent amidase/aminoacylase/carboxypeptidase family protein